MLTRHRAREAEIAGEVGAGVGGAPETAQNSANLRGDDVGQRTLGNNDAERWSSATTLTTKANTTVKTAMEATQNAADAIAGAANTLNGDNVLTQTRGMRDDAGNDISTVSQTRFFPASFRRYPDDSGQQPEAGTNGLGARKKLDAADLRADLTLDMDADSPRVRLPFKMRTEQPHLQDSGSKSVDTTPGNTTTEPKTPFWKRLRTPTRPKDKALRVSSSVTIKYPEEFFISITDEAYQIKPFCLEITLLLNEAGIILVCRVII